ncbi:hypothetical protein OUZ56_011980 [Daphnia magna]|uniref:Uncharacterized protein n=1 Tax=Daphnia magna TaxID=35525 RepID=A0ABQ9Z1P2_9CRUS|nr:hypothetical protein OUZ56_011980 [Daphnia magna]
MLAKGTLIKGLYIVFTQKKISLCRVGISRVFMVTKALILAFTGATVFSTKKNPKNIIVTSGSNTGLPHTYKLYSEISLEPKRDKPERHYTFK